MPNMRRQPAKCSWAMGPLVLLVLLVFVGVVVWSGNGNKTSPSLRTSLTTIPPPPIPTHPDPSPPRIAILIPYLGTHLPAYFDLFKWSASGSSSLVDFFIFVSDQTTNIANHEASSPSNVKFINVGGVDKMAELHARVAFVSEDGSEREMKISKEHLVDILTKQLKKHPYQLVEYKPAYGHIFKDYIKDYSHWGYADLDCIFGDLAQWISPDELEEFDITTYSHGDQASVYLRGQFTMHKNNHLVNNVWRGCEHLSKLDERYDGGKKYRFESAEGCYSHAVLQRKDIKVKYAVKAMTDFNKADSAHAHGIMVAEQEGGKLVLYKASEADKTGNKFRSLDPEGIYSGRAKGEGLYKDVGEMEVVMNYKYTEKELPNRGRGCMFWAPTTYQRDICVQNVDSSYTIKLIEGTLYKQKWEKFNFPNDVISAPFFHFQEWKRKYRASQFAGLVGGGGRRQFILMTEGLALFRYAGDGSADLEKLEEEKVTWPKDQPKYLLPTKLYCSTFESVRADNDGKKTEHCVDYVSWFDKEKTEVLKWPSGSMKLETTATLSIVVSLPDLGDKGGESRKRFKAAMASIRDWKDGPIVFVIHVKEGGSKAALLSLISAHGLDKAKNTLCVLVRSAKYNRKALLNMANDAVSTRFVLTNINPDSGMKLGEGVFDVVQRATQDVGKDRGLVYLIPHYSVPSSMFEDPNGINLGTLVDMKQKGRAQLYEKEGCGPGGDIFEAMESKWEKGGGAVNGAASTIVRTMLEGEGEEAEELFKGKLPPVLLVDRKGPRSGLLTDLVGRQFEEMDGDDCFSFLQLGSLLSTGYKFGVLGGSFVISPPSIEAKNAEDCKRSCLAVDKKSSIEEIFKAGIKVIAMSAIGSL